MNDVARWCSCEGATRGCVPRNRYWLPRRDDRSTVLIGAGGTRRSDWPERVKCGRVACTELLPRRLDFDGLV